MPFDQRAVFSDFDGTLARIVSKPEDAVPVPGAVNALAALADAGCVVGVITGRPAEFVQDALGLGGLVYVGLHGLERAEGLGRPSPVPAVAALLDDLQAIRGQLVDSVPAGVALEDKRFALTLHYRNAADPAAARSQALELAAAAASGRPFVVQPGRMCWEVLPDLPIDKGSALLAEAERARAESVTFCGDDIGDVHAFDALDRLAARGVAVTRVAVASDESPPELVRRADIRLKGPEEVATYLAALA